MQGAFDVAIVGSGFAGSLLALVARRLGLSVVLLEKGSHPRFAIGESTSPLANLLLEELARRYDFPRLLPFAKWGSWRRAYPHVSCGLKRGFSFFHHAEGRPFANAPDRQDQLLVGASPNDEVADTHWYRPEFDHFLQKEAEEAGTRYLDRTALSGVTREKDRWLLTGERAGAVFTFKASFLVDASGRSGALHEALGVRRVAVPFLPSTRALFTHFEGVRRLDEMGIPGDLGIPPYPIDDAAVHHVFPGGWIWILRFGNGLTSAGVAASEALAEKAGFARGEAGWKRLLERFPTIRAQFEAARPTVPFVHVPRLSFRVDRAAGLGWALLPSAAAFVDPLLSTGFPLALLGIHRLAEVLEKDFGTARLDAGLAAYGALTLEEADRSARLVAALYSAFGDFPLFVELSKLYFAAAHFSESARRAGRPDLAGTFLCGSHAEFGPAFDACCRAALAPREASSRERLLADVARAVALVDLAGLLDPSRRNWFEATPLSVSCAAFSAPA
ncbi:MAG TPA: FAD-dependent oxidoreductase [Thermoanaerobaculia bacterium]|nr:FAD-dependent oxidoreductase [Thermoanaerobaculia bacterium]